MNQAPDFLDAVRREIETASTADLPGIIGGLETRRATAWARWFGGQQTPVLTPQSGKAEEFVTVKEAAARLGMSEKWVRQHKEQLGGTRLGASLRFQWSRIEAYVRRRQISR